MRFSGERLLVHMWSNRAVWDMRNVTKIWPTPSLIAAAPEMLAALDGDSWNARSLTARYNAPSHATIALLWLMPPSPKRRGNHALRNDAKEWAWRYQNRDETQLSETTDCPYGAASGRSRFAQPKRATTLTTFTLGAFKLYGAMVCAPHARRSTAIMEGI